MTITELGEAAYENAIKKGFEGGGRSPAEEIALMHSELSEALEEYRSGNLYKGTYYGPDGKPEGLGIELADCVIRIANFCKKYDIPLQACIDEKHGFNLTRPYQHGGKLI